MADDPWKNTGDLTSQIRKLQTVTPAAVDFARVARAVVILAAGDVTLVPADNATGETFTFVGLPSGTVLPILTRRITAATATVAISAD